MKRKWVAKSLEPVVLTLVSVLLTAAACAATEVKMERINYKGWQGSYRLSAGDVSLVVVPAIGGRIMEYSRGGVNICWENEAEAGKVHSPNEEWVNYGGYKTWQAPQDKWREKWDGWPPDMALAYGPAKADVTADGVLRLVGSRSEKYGLYFTREISLAADGKVVLKQGLHSLADQEQAWAVWDVTQVNAPGVAFFPAFKKSEYEGGFRCWDDKAKGSGQFRVEDGLVIAAWDGLTQAKIGGRGEAGWIAYVCEGLVYLKKYDYDAKGEYSDGGTSAQVYTNTKDVPYVEIEALGPLKRMKKGESVWLGEEWHLLELPRELKEATTGRGRELRKVMEWLNWEGILNTGIIHDAILPPQQDDIPPLPQREGEETTK